MHIGNAATNNVAVFFCNYFQKEAKIPESIKNLSVYL